MKTQIYCQPTQKGIHSFYLVTSDGEYFLFNQNYRKSVHNYFCKGVPLSGAIDFSKTHHDSALTKTMSKLPMYIKYLEKEFDIQVFKKTKKRNLQCV